MGRRRKDWPTISTNDSPYVTVPLGTSEDRPSPQVIRRTPYRRSKPTVRKACHDRWDELRLRAIGNYQDGRYSLEQLEKLVRLIHTLPNVGSEAA